MTARRILGLTGALVLFVAAVGNGLEVPYLAGRINDQADILSDGAEQQLEGQLKQLEEETGAQIAILTIPTLDGDPIEDFSMRVVETWKLGRAGVDDGVLILIARDDRRMRIEVGYGLEGALTDAQSGRIIHDLMTPRFREGDFDGGVSDAVGAVSAAVRGEPLPLPEEKPAGTGGNPIAVLAMLIMGIPFITGALTTRGAAGWIVYLFLAPFFFAVPASAFGTRVGVHIGLLWLLGFPILRLVWPKAPPGGGKGSGTAGGFFFGPFVGGGGGGGGFSGGGFSGGGGSFGGGGASGGW